MQNVNVLGSMNFEMPGPQRTAKNKHPNLPFDRRGTETETSAVKDIKY
jgi:hypothetical protein